MELEIKKELKKILGQDVTLEIPPESMLGDYAFPCFSLAKQFKKSPNEIALDLKKKLEKKFRVETKGPYLNFFIDKTKFAKSVFSKVLKEKDKYGSQKKWKEKIMIEFSQANTHKAFHVGHTRGTSLGESLSRILDFLGYKVMRVNYQGDTGMHVAKWLWYYTKFMNYEKFPKQDIEKWVASIYVEAVKKLDMHPEYQEEVDKINYLLENGKDKKLMDLWEKTRKLSLDAFEAIYRDLDTKFDHYFFEREMEKEGKKIAYELLKKKIAKVDEGATIVDLREYGLGVWVLLRKDGTVLYSAKDLALAKIKFEKFKIDKNIYVVGAAQRMHFYQLFKTLELMNFKNAKNCIYIPVSEVRLPTGKMSSRTGENIVYSEFRNEIMSYAISEIKKRHKGLSQKKIEKRALIISIGAVKFNMLKQDLNKTIIFDKTEAIRFEGDTGPYVQYAYARCSSILKGAKIGRFNADLFNETDFSVVKLIEQFPNVVEKAGEEYKPSLIANYLLDLAKTFNEFYTKNIVLKAEKDLREARLALVFSTRQILRNGLYLLGIDAPNEM